MKGLFVSLEGPEGAGKSTQIALIRNLLQEKQIPFMIVREPGGTRIGDLIRNILLNPELTEMTQRTEMLLYAASRAQLVEQKIIPALRQGQMVLCDRYVDSSIVYQSIGAKWDLDEVIAINDIATGCLKPDRTYLLDLPVEISQQRLLSRQAEKDRIEMKDIDFHLRVREGYLALAQEEPERFRVIKATGSIEEVFEQIADDLRKLIEVHYK
ncbi:dTMP kinase [Thermoflavimicrobium dichotomicum]|uniref:Thymidylate kinase n=1 Tax=Thermoflavimicrobium dichotomicum TaxID=46223 RepID=A0A1I3QP95_9BACL|nr:dTMP kinase [Thermoflavimicrobium dichotomicum]SFJ34937.1 dTMP kinase [Thermoflavimicrobium dichotomicum]